LSLHRINRQTFTSRLGRTRTAPVILLLCCVEVIGEEQLGVFQLAIWSKENTFFVPNKIAFLLALRNKCGESCSLQHRRRRRRRRRQQAHTQEPPELSAGLPHLIFQSHPFSSGTFKAHDMATPAPRGQIRFVAVGRKSDGASGAVVVASHVFYTAGALPAK
jgi:hypothetical protein